MLFVVLVKISSFSLLKAGLREFGSLTSSGSIDEWCLKNMELFFSIFKFEFILNVEEERLKNKFELIKK